MLDAKDVLKQISDLQKATFDIVFGAVNQGEKVMAAALEKATFLPDGGKERVSGWVENYKKNVDDLKSSVEEALESSLNPTELVKQSLKLQKTAFDTIYGTFETLQNQGEQILGKILDIAKIPDGGKDAIQTFLDTVKGGQENFKSTVDDSFEKVYNYFEE